MSPSRSCSWSTSWATAAPSSRSSRSPPACGGAGWDVTVVTLIPPVRAWSTSCGARRGGAVPGHAPRRAQPRRRSPGCARSSTSRAPRVVHSHIVHANLLARAARLLSRMPVLVCTAHSISEGSRLLELGYRLTDRLADLTTNVSQAGVDRYVRIGAAPAGRIRFVPNGLDLARFHPDEAARGCAPPRAGRGRPFVWLAVGPVHRGQGLPQPAPRLRRRARRRTC